MNGFQGSAFLCARAYRSLPAHSDEDEFRLRLEPLRHHPHLQIVDLAIPGHPCTAEDPFELSPPVMETDWEAESLQILDKSTGSLIAWHATGRPPEDGE